MRRRCNDPRFVAYPFYGALGVKVCDEWNDGQNGYAAFVRDLGERPANMTLDRRDPNGNYEPGNCFWATRVWQDWNKRKVREMVEEMREREYWEEEEKRFLAGS